MYERLFLFVIICHINTAQMGLSEKCHLPQRVQRNHKKRKVFNID